MGPHGQAGTLASEFGSVGPIHDPQGKLFILELVLEERPEELAQLMPSSEDA